MTFFQLAEVLNELRTMTKLQFVLACATILGGIAAAWFFWDKIFGLIRQLLTPDLRKLDKLTQTEISAHEAQGKSKLIIGEHWISISRPIVQEMLTAVRSDSVLVEGGAGTGKTGCLLELAKQLRQGGQRVWYWAADSLPYHSPQEIGVNLNLRLPWEVLLSKAARRSETTLIIDGLDGLRDASAQRAYRNLLGLAVENGIKVVTSIRSFDLMYSVELREMFSPKGRTITVTDLDDEEFGQVLSNLTDVNNILDVSPQLRPVVRNLFSLDLLCKLIQGGESVSELSTISTQAELFEEYWRRRIDSHELREEMIEALRSLIESMVREKTLQVAQEPWSTQVRDALFSADIVRNPLSTPGRLLQQDLVEFNHHLLFDYVAERLFVRPRRTNLVAELSAHDTWGFFLRPSLVLFHRYAWVEGRNDFWETLLELVRASVSILQQLPGYLVVAEEVRNRQDLEPLLQGCLGNESDNAYWTPIVPRVVSAAEFSSLPRLFNSSSGDWWVEFARDLILTGNSQLVPAGQRLLFITFEAVDNLSDNARHLLNQAAVALVKFRWREDAHTDHAIRPPIKWICRTINSDVQASSEIIRKILSTSELQRAGYIQAYEVAHYLEDIWKADPILAVDAYDAIFGYVETDQSDTPLGSGQILSMISNRSQDYRMAYYNLSKKFPSFLSARPKEATIALIKVIRHYMEQERRGRVSPSADTFLWNDHVCHLKSDSSYISDWDREYMDDHEKMLHAWGDYIVKLPDDEQADEKWNELSTVVATTNDLAVVWRRLLLSASQSPEFYAERIWTILLNPVILVGPDTWNAAEDCVEAFSSYLPEETIRQIEATILGISRQHFTHLNTEALEESYIQRSIAQLLCRVPEERRSHAAKEFLASCDTELLIPRPRERGVEVTCEEMTTEKWLAMDGVDVLRPKHQELLGISDFIEKLNINDITDDNLQDLLWKLHNLERELEESCDEIDSRLASRVKERIISGFSKIAQSEATLSAQLKEELFEYFRDILIEPVDSPSLQELEQFDQSQGWGIPYPRLDAARGIISLALKGETIPDEYRDMLLNLANDPEPVPRYFLGTWIWSLLDKWPDFVWDTLEGWVTELRTQKGTVGVLSGTLRNSWFWWLRNNDASRADNLLKNLLFAARQIDLKDLKTHCGMWLAALSFFEGEDWATDTLREALVRIKDYLAELEGAQRIAKRELLPREGKEIATGEKRQRALNFQVHFLQECAKELKEYSIQITNLPLSDRPADQPDWVKQVAHLMDYTATEFQFSAEGLMKHAEREELMGPWWENAEPILDALLEFPHPGIMYPLVQGIGCLVEHDVNRSFHWLRKVTLAGVPSGLALEQLAADHTIGILEQVLAEHRASLADEDELRTDFLQILEAYLDVGWPRAIQLAIELDRIYR